MIRAVGKSNQNSAVRTPLKEASMNKMILQSTILLISLAGIAMSEEAKIPKSCEKIIKDMENDISRIKTKAVSLLEKEMRTYTKNGDLVSAIQIKGKMDELVAQNIVANAVTSGTGVTVNDKLVIKKAMYGVNGSEFDVTEEVGKAMRDDKSITINDSMKGDPAPFIVKRLIINYIFMGKEVEKKFPQNLILKLYQLE